LSEIAKRPVVLVADPFHESGYERLRDTFDLVFRPPSGFRAEDLAHAEAVVVRTFLVTREWLAQTPRLRVVVKHGAGVDNIDIPAASERGVLVANTPGGANATSVAEGAVALMLAVRRRIKEMDALVRAGRFDDRWKVALPELYGQQLGLVGFGRIGREVGRICRLGFQMNVRAFDPFVAAEDMAAEDAVKADNIAEVMGADAVSVHVPLGRGTRGLIGPAELAAMKPSGIIVNTSRGGIIDEDALASALGRGRLAGAALDVFAREPPSLDHALFRLDNVIVTPHVAGVTVSSMIGMAQGVAQVIEQFFQGAVPPTALNADLIPASR
jgi:D-3-phosphoglycerate dehydrogenase